MTWSAVVPRRRTLVPGALAVRADTLWAADFSQPALARIAPTAPAALYRWNGRHGSDRYPVEATLHADGGGCWVSGCCGVRYCSVHGGTTAVLTEPVQFAALHSSTMAAVPARQDSMTRTAVRLLGGENCSHTLTVPGRVSALVTDDDGFLLMLCSDAASAAQQEVRIARLRLPDTLTVGPVVGVRARVRGILPLTGGTAVVHDAGDQSEPAGLRRLRPDLRLDPATPLRALHAAWSGEDRLWVAVDAWHPDPRRWWPLAGEVPTIDGSASHAAVIELDPSSLQPTAATHIAAVPDHVVGEAHRPVWLQLWVGEQAGHADVGHQLLRWQPGAGDGPAVVDLAQRLGGDITLPVRLPPGAPPDLEAWARQQQRLIDERLRPGILGRIEIVNTTLAGSFPDAHVVVFLRVRDVPNRTAAVAYPLFDANGAPRPADHPLAFHRIRLDEQLDTTAIQYLRSATPDADGVVWLAPPRPPEGLLTEMY